MKTEFRKQISWCEHYGVCQSVNCVSCPNKKGKKMNHEALKTAIESVQPELEKIFKKIWLEGAYDGAKYERERCAEIAELMSKTDPSITVEWKNACLEFARVLRTTK